MGNDKNWMQIVAEKDARITELEVLVNYYEELLRLSKSQQFGASSEKFDIHEQLGIFDEAESAADCAPEPELEQITYSRRKTVGKREADLSALPVEEVEYTLPEDGRGCPECGELMHVMGHDCRRYLKIVPA